jgi:hypothetical protein
MDEALTDFLSFWNPMVLRLRERVPWSPLPTFTFDVWLSGLVLVLAVLALLSVFAYQDSPWLRPVAYVYGSLMLLNGFAHIAISLFQGRPAPGVTSAPLLIGTSAWLLVSLIRTRSYAPDTVRDPENDEGV